MSSAIDGWRWQDGSPVAALMGGGGLGQAAASSIQTMEQMDIGRAQDRIKSLQASLTASTKKKEQRHMFGFAKEYLDKHKDTVMTVVVALLVDHFFLGGALREKIKQLTESILDNAQKKLSRTPALEKKDADKSAA